tara:strand:- start:1140 stop:1397 length:258 start_codon:yes stop_codon:yes gene_type:complete
MISMAWEDVIKVGSQTFDYRERAGQQMVEDRKKQELEKLRRKTQKELYQMLREVDEKQKLIEQKKKILEAKEVADLDALGISLGD